MDGHQQHRLGGSPLGFALLSLSSARPDPAHTCQPTHAREEICVQRARTHKHKSKRATWQDTGQIYTTCLYTIITIFTTIGLGTGAPLSLVASPRSWPLAASAVLFRPSRHDSPLESPLSPLHSIHALRARHALPRRMPPHPARTHKRGTRARFVASRPAAGA